MKKFTHWIWTVAKVTYYILVEDRKIDLARPELGEFPLIVNNFQDTF